MVSVSSGALACTSSAAAGSWPPEAALGLVTDDRPCGRSSGWLSCPAATMPATPVPVR